MTPETKIIITVLGVLVVGTGAVVLTKSAHKSTNDGAVPSEEVTAEEKIPAPTMEGYASFAQLLSLGQSLRCDVVHETGDAVSTGVVFFDGGMMRGNFSGTQNGATFAANVISRDDTTYVWSENQMGSQGMRIDARAGNQVPGAGISTPDIAQPDQNVTYKCVEWSVDPSLFEVPSTIQFVDLNPILGSK